MDEVGSRRRGFALASFLLAATIVLVSVLGAVWASASLRDAQEDLAAEIASDLAAGVRTVIERDAAVATALAGRIDDPAALDQATWSTIVQRPWRTGAFRQVSGVNVAVRVTDDASLEAVTGRLARLDGEVDLRLGDGPSYLILTNVWPEAPNRAAVGFDVLANPVAAEAALQALRLGTPAASAP